MNEPGATFWDERYAAGRTPWDQPQPPRIFADFLSRQRPAGRAFVPGCGSGYELRALHESGWQTLGIDYSRAAVARAQNILGALAELVRYGDFFARDATFGSFDLVYERTFLCALSPARRKDYGQRMAELIKPGGVLCGFFFFGPEDDPPPHPIDEAGLKQILGSDFEKVEDMAVLDSLPLFAGKERWQVWRRQ